MKYLLRLLNWLVPDVRDEDLRLDLQNHFE